MILYTMRAVTSAFTANDMMKNAVGAARISQLRTIWSSTLLLISKLRVVNAVTMM